MMVHKVDKDKRELLQRAEDFEELAVRRLKKIHTLEAQLRQFVYDVSKSASKKFAAGIVPGAFRAGAGEGGAGAVDVGDTATLVSEDNALLSDLIDEKGGDLSPDENLLEIWVKGATVKDGRIPTGASTFVVIDFFDYESQTTALVSGHKPLWDFAATFKIHVDDFLLRYLATDVITLELNLVSKVHPRHSTNLQHCPASRMILVTCHAQIA